MVPDDDFIPAQASYFLQTALIPQDRTMVSVSSAQKFRVWPSGFSRPPLIRLAVAGVIALPFLWIFSRSFMGKPFSRLCFVLGDEGLSGNPPKLQSIPQTHKNMVVASVFGAHFDVYDCCLDAAADYA